MYYVITVIYNPYPVNPVVLDTPGKSLVLPTALQNPLYFFMQVNCNIAFGTLSSSTYCASSWKDLQLPHSGQLRRSKKFILDLKQRGNRKQKDFAQLRRLNCPVREVKCSPSLLKYLQKLYENILTRVQSEEQCQSTV